MAMNEAKAREYLHSLGKFGIKMGLSRITLLLEELDNPHDTFCSVHVTGTNGKGSTTAMIASILTTCGFRTGMYTSPHLLDYPERFQIDGVEISWRELGALLDEVRQAAQRVVAAGEESPTEFEVLTAAAFLWYARKKVGFAVVEVGLGGLLDSTNVIDPEVCVITNVGIEHADRLGADLKFISAHKSGIIKYKVPTVTGVTTGVPLNIIKRTAREKYSKLYVPGRDFEVSNVSRSGTGHTFQLRLLAKKAVVQETEFFVPLAGRHQVDNAALAITACLAIAKKEPRLSYEAIAVGLAATKWPGRFEIFGGNPPVVVDGAHNPDGAHALRKTLDDIYKDRPVVFLFGSLADKDYKTVIDILFRPGDRAVTFRPDSDRAADPESIAQEIRKHGNEVEIETDPAAALQRCKELAVPAGVVCVTGSLYMIGEFRRLLCVSSR